MGIRFGYGLLQTDVASGALGLLLAESLEEGLTSAPGIGEDRKERGSLVRFAYQNPGRRILTISACTAGLLQILLHIVRETVVDDRSDIAFVNAQSIGRCGYQNPVVRVLEPFLQILPRMP